MAFPQQEGGVFGLDIGEPTQVEPGIPYRHVGFGVAHGVAGVAAEVLVGEEQHLAPPGAALVSGSERPLEHGASIGRGAHGTPVLAHERLERGRGVHVGNGNEQFEVGDLAQLVPGVLDLADVGHVCHGAAGIEVGEQHPLVVAGEDVSRLRHEVHPAEHDRGGLWMFLGED